MSKFKVVWDNGHATGALPDEYDTEEAAERAGEDWRNEMIALDPNAAEAAEAYSYDVVEAA